MDIRNMLVDICKRLARKLDDGGEYLFNNENASNTINHISLILAILKDKHVDFGKPLPTWVTMRIAVILNDDDLTDNERKTLSRLIGRTA